jgi:hypothetical protein
VGGPGEAETTKPTTGVSAGRCLVPITRASCGKRKGEVDRRRGSKKGKGNDPDAGAAHSQKVRAEIARWVWLMKSAGASLEKGLLCGRWEKLSEGRMEPQLPGLPGLQWVCVSGGMITG